MERVEIKRIADYLKDLEEGLVDVFAQLHWRFLRDNSLGRPEYC